MRSAIVTRASKGIEDVCARLETLAAALADPAVVAFRISAEAAYVNGAELPVDSGATVVGVSGAALTSA